MLRVYPLELQIMVGFVVGVGGLRFEGMSVVSLV